MDNRALGTLATLLGACFWGTSGACGQYLFTNYVIDSAWLTALRMFVAGLLLTLFSCLVYRHRLRELFSSSSDLKRLFLFAVLGVLLGQYTYLEAIAQTNAGTATVLSYTMPVMVLGYVCLSERRRPTLKEAAAISLAASGVVILATHGNLEHLVMTPTGLAWGLAAGFTMAVYSLLPRNLMARYGSVPVVGTGMLLGGIIASFPARLWRHCPDLDIYGIAAILGVVLLGTLFSFTLYLTGVRMIGAVKASMLSSVEPVVATLLSVVWLGTSFMPLDIAGFALVIAAVLVTASGTHSKA